ncbi:MAG: hypothetical protein MZW92_17590 [Comamonadaceae bacterium]|nr:hypothetical protein [Comamonadaceae bacterium]
MPNIRIPYVLGYCRAGFENECAAEIAARAAAHGISGHVAAAAQEACALFRFDPPVPLAAVDRVLRLRDLAFARQLVFGARHLDDLPAGNRIAPLAQAAAQFEMRFSEVLLETADTNEGKRPVDPVPPPRRPPERCTGGGRIARSESRQRPQPACLFRCIPRCPRRHFAARKPFRLADGHSAAEDAARRAQPLHPEAGGSPAHPARRRRAHNLAAARHARRGPRRRTRWLDLATGEPRPPCHRHRQRQHRAGRDGHRHGGAPAQRRLHLAAAPAGRLAAVRHGGPACAHCRSGGRLAGAGAGTTCHLQSQAADEEAAGGSRSLPRPRSNSAGCTPPASARPCASSRLYHDREEVTVYARRQA